MHVFHSFGPYYQKDSKVLILGSIPSVKSREIGFYYAHPKNRFWRVLASIYEEEIPKTILEQQDFLKRHHIALWDVIKSCDIKGSSDASIKNIIPNDITSLINKTSIKAIFTTGKKAKQLYDKYCYPKTKIHAIYLPSTSPAYCPKNIDHILYENYRQIKKITNEKTSK